MTISARRKRVNLYMNDEIKKKDEYKLKGEIEIKNVLGETIFKKNNLILMPGRRFILEKLFNIKCKDFVFPDLRKQLGIPEPYSNENIDDVNMPLREICVCLFGIGIGGSGLTLGDIYNPTYSDLKLKNCIPMRVVDKDNDLSKDEKEKYFLRHEFVEGGVEKVAYYLKKFECVPEIKMKPLGQSEHNGAQDWDVYVEMKMKIDESDVREYFESINEVEKTRINELSLIYGYQPKITTNDGYVDYTKLESFSAVSFNNEALEGDNKELHIIYRVYA